MRRLWAPAWPRGNATTHRPIGAASRPDRGEWVFRLTQTAAPRLQGGRALATQRLQGRTRRRWRSAPGPRPEPPRERRDDQEICPPPSLAARSQRATAPTVVDCRLRQRSGRPLNGVRRHSHVGGARRRRSGRPCSTPRAPWAEMRAVIVRRPAAWGAARQIELGTHRAASAPKQSNTAGNRCIGNEIRDDGARVSPSHAGCQ